MSEVFEVKRARRSQARLRIAFQAASNGGKTWSALELAFGLVSELLDRKVLAGGVEGKVGLLDTERKSANLYDHLGPFDTVELGPPYTVERYVGAMQSLERAGCAVIILDSISPAWRGAGGLLSVLNKFKDNERFSSFEKTINPAQDEFIDAMLRSPCHIIATMRSKTEWVLEDKVTRSGATVKAPRRIGMAPIQRDGIEYEFTTLLDLDTESHRATVLKNRCPVFQDWEPKLITREHGRALAGWLLEGAPVPAEVVSGTPLEQAEAVRDSALRRFKACSNVPDLATVFNEAQKALRAFPPAVSVEAIVPMLQTVVEAKDARKAQLGGNLGDLQATRPAVLTLDPGAAADIETACMEGGIAIGALLQARGFGVDRLMAVPKDQLQRVVNVVDEALRVATGDGIKLTGRLRSFGVVEPVSVELVGAGAFDSMVPDLPWDDPA